jgi:hypothetical protein
MAMLLKVNWVDLSDQDDPYQRIRNIGGNSKGLEWKHTCAQALLFIDRGEFCYCVEQDDLALKLKVGLAPDGAKFLKTDADSDQPQSLLSLAENSRSKSGQGRSALRA